MATVALDTLKVSKRLREAGFSEAQAESVTEAIREGVVGGDLATKTDLSVLRGDLSVLRGEMKADLSELKAELIKWMVGMVLAQGALVVTLMKLLPGKL